MPIIYIKPYVNIITNVTLKPVNTNLTVPLVGTVEYDYKPIIANTTMVPVKGSIP